MKIKKQVATICLVLGLVSTLNIVTYSIKNDSPINREDLKKFKS